MARKGRIENWQEVEWVGKHTRIAGNVYECEGYAEEGELWVTNNIVQYHNVWGNQVVETASGSMYTLGTPATEPKTLQKLFAEAMGN